MAFRLTGVIEALLGKIKRRQRRILFQCCILQVSDSGKGGTGAASALITHWNGFEMIDVKFVFKRIEINAAAGFGHQLCLQAFFFGRLAELRKINALETVGVNIFAGNSRFLKQPENGF